MDGICSAMGKFGFFGQPVPGSVPFGSSAAILLPSFRLSRHASLLLLGCLRSQHSTPRDLRRTSSPYSRSCFPCLVICRTLTPPAPLSMFRERVLISPPGQDFLQLTDSDRVVNPAGLRQQLTCANALKVIPAARLTAIGHRPPRLTGTPISSLNSRTTSRFARWASAK
ncbi:hypothetical protein HPP92_013029 [Vanilla planifolia]|nr:hypothetical protein HPP92_013029 [Vanilla planifolia]